MKKKEIRWVSRNNYSQYEYEMWSKEPALVGGIWEGSGYRGSPCEAYLQAYAGIKLKHGGLAKITIERQY